MTTLRGILTLGAILGFAASWAGATEYTFNVTSGVWETAGNWDPDTGPPGAGDTAIIPSGKTCRVEDDDQEAKIVQVYGTLGLVGKDLILGQNDTATTSTVDGTFYFEKVSTVKGKLKVRDWVTFDGDGELTASKGDDSDYAGWIGLYVEYVDGDPPYLIVRGVGIKLDDTIVLTGTVELWCRIEIKQYAAIVVDHADDIFDVGGTYGLTEAALVLDGDGKFDVDAGELEIGWVVFDATTPRWELSGGEIELIDVPDPINDTFTGLTVQIDMSGGTLDIDDPFSTTGVFTFSGGTIELAQGKTAAFTP